MGVLDGLKRAFSICGSKITVVLEHDVYSQFDSIRGNVIITAPEYRQAGRGIHLQLKEFWTEIRSTGKTMTTTTVHRSHDDVLVHGAFDFEPGSQHRLHFEVDLPRNCRISTRSTGWCLYVTMDIPAAIDPKERVVLTVQPAEEFLAIVEACEEHLRFQEKRSSRRWIEHSARTSFRLLPPEVLSPELDDVVLELSQTPDRGVEGELIINPQEKSIVDYFKAILRRDRIRKPLRFTADQLFAADGQIDRGAIALRIGTVLEEVIQSRGAS